MNHTYIFISDTELGRGDITDDFRDSQSLIDFLEKVERQQSEKNITLVLNGDTFDFLKMSYQGAYPLLITEEISLWKLREVIKTYPSVFSALKKFVENPKNSIHFVIGNHDFDLIWPALQQEIQALLGVTERVTFDFYFTTPNIHAEHGHLEDPLFVHDHTKPIIEYKEEKVLNLPWGSWACSTHLIKVKHAYPEEERMYPKLMLFRSHKGFRTTSRIAALKLVFQSFINKIATERKHGIYHFPLKKLVKHAIKYKFDFLDDEKFLPERMARVAQKHPDKKIIVLGHAHVIKDYSKGDQKILITDTWRHEKDMRTGAIKKKSYAQVSYSNGELVSAIVKTVE